MKKEMIGLILIGMLLVLPLISAEEQTQMQYQTYSGFSRFFDNVRLFFSSEESKVDLALEIREKEITSAIANLENEDIDSANENLDNALEKLLIVQEKVSYDSADNVETSVQEVVEIIEEENLTETFDRYVLEEEKTQLVAELVIEINRTEGQTLTREVVQSENENRKTVRVTVQNENGEIEEIETEGRLRNNTTVREIVGGINEIDNGIQEWVVERTYAEGTTAEGESDVVESSRTKDNEDISPALNIIDDDVAPGPQGIVGYQGDDTYNADGTIREEHVEEGGNGGNTANNDDSDNSDSDEVDSVTGEAIKEIESSDNFLTRFFKGFF